MLLDQIQSPLGLRILRLADGSNGLGAEVNAVNAAWQERADWGGGPYPEVSVRNRAIDLGLVTEET